MTVYLLKKKTLVQMGIQQKARRLVKLFCDLFYTKISTKKDVF